MESFDVSASTARPLAGERVALAGRFASLPRAEIERLIALHGGRIGAHVGRSTTLLILGEQGWPLGKQGRLSRKLQTARWLQRRGQEIEIISEDAFFRRIGCVPEDGPATRHYSIIDLVRTTGASRARLTNWIAAGLIQPDYDHGGVPYFDFRQVCRVRSLLDLARGGVAQRQLRRSLVQLGRWLPDIPVVMDALGRLERHGRRLVLELPDGQLVEPGGQRVMRFDADDEPRVVPFDRRAAGDDTFARAVRLEEQGEFAAAASLYNELLAADGPDVEVCFNLGNVLYAAGQPDAAIERFEQAVELDPTYAEAWYNLGTLLFDLQHGRDAIRALQRAVEVAPGYAAARSALADALDECGDRAAAEQHWRAYLELDDTGDWAEHARERLQQARA